jgi:tape measure domain-containing protein
VSIDVKVRIGGESKGAVDGINSAINAVRKLKEEQRGATGDGQALRESLNVRSDDITRAAEAVRRLKEEQRGAAASGEALQDSLNPETDAIEEATEALEELGEAANEASEESFDLNDALGSIQNTILGFIGFSFFKTLATDILATNIEMESLRARLLGLSGSAEEAGRNFDFILRFARDTPFEIAGLTQSFAMLQQVGIEPTAETMQAFTDQAAKLGGGQEVLTSIILQTSQAYSKGKLQMEDMIVLMERGVPVMKLLEVATGKNSDELAEMASKGELTRDVIEEMIKVMGEMAEGGSAVAMDTLKGKISNLSDAWHQFEDTLLQDKSEGLIKSIVESATSAISNFTQMISSNLDDQIAFTERRIEQLRQNKIGGGPFEWKDKLFNRSIEEEQRDLGILKGKRDQKAEEDARANSRKEIEKWNKFVAEDEDRGAQKTVESSKKRASAAESRARTVVDSFRKEREAVAETIAEIERETSLIGKSNVEVSRASELHRALANAKGAEVEAIKAALEAKWQEIDANERQSEQWKQLVIDANAYYDLRKDIDKLATPNISAKDFLSGRDKIQEKLDIGAIDSQQAEVEFDKLGKAWKERFIEPAKESTNELSEFSKEAARASQNAFADFLFDPFADGASGMVEGFARAVRRMAAEAASAKIFESLLGSNFGKSGDMAGGLLSIFGAAIGGMFGGGHSSGSGFQGNGPLLSYTNKHSGGIVGNGGGQSWARPEDFDAAPRYHSGGIVGLKPRERPIIALDDEEVLTSGDPRHINNFKGGGASVVINVSNNADGTRASASSRQTDQGTQVDIIIEQVERAIGSNIARGSGIAPALERQYGLNRSAGSF